MTDNVKPEVRSAIMSRIRSIDTALELRFRRALHAKGLRYRLHSRLFGRPDIVFSRSKILVFVDSCFWHGCALHCRHPKTNTAFWREKINRNSNRHRELNLFYRKTGWLVFRVWEHELDKHLNVCVMRLFRLVMRRRGSIPPFSL